MAERSLLVRLGADISAFERATSRAMRSVQRFGRALQNVGQNLTAAVTAPLVGLGTVAVAASEQLDDAMDKIRAGTGATGQNLEALGGILRSVFAEVPASAADVATAVADLNTRLGLTGPALQAMSTQMLQLAKLSGGEVAPLIASTSAAFASWGVTASDQSRILDRLWQTSQSTGIGVSQLADQVAQGGATFRAMGVPIETGVALLGHWQRAGIGADQVIAGLTRGAGAFAKRGQDMGTGMAAVLQQIRAAPSASAAASVAVETFGKAGIAMADAVRRGAFDVQAFTATLAASSETIAKAAADTAGLGEAFTRLKNAATLALEPLGVAITPILIGMMDRVRGLVISLQALTEAFGRLAPETQRTIVVLGMIAAAIGPALVALGGLIIFIAKIVTSVVGLAATIVPMLTSLGAWATAAGAMITSAWAAVAAAFTGLLAAIAPLVTTVLSVGRALLALAGGPVGLAIAALIAVALNWNVVRDTALRAGAAMSSELSSTWAAIQAKTRAAWTSIEDTLKSGITRAASAVQELFAGLLDSATALGMQIVDALSQALGWVAEVAGKVWESLVTGVTGAVRHVIVIIEALWQRARAIAAAIVETLLQAFSTSPSAPAGPGAAPSAKPFAFGGLVTRPTFAMLGEAGPELVLPLSRLSKMPRPDIAGKPILDPFEERRPSLVFPTSQVRMAPSVGRFVPPVAPIGPRGGGPVASTNVVINLVVNGSVQTQRDLAEQLRQEIVRIQQRNRTSGIV